MLENLRRFPAGASWEYVAAAAVLPIAARITGRNEHSEVASNAATEVLAAQNLGPWIAHHAHIGGALLALQKKESEEALREDYAQLAGTIGMPSLFGTTAERILGLICCKLGDLNQAVTHFEKGSAFCRRAGYRPELAWSCCDYADTLLQRNEAGDHEKALSLLEESLAISTELGMRPLMERVRSRLGSLDSVMPAEAGYPDGLTQREVEVLRIITQGKSNREIGDELVIAESTVRRHVSNIYDKIGVSNRTEAARFALAQGLVALEESGSSNT